MTDRDPWDPPANDWMDGGELWPAPPDAMTQERYDDLKETAKARLLEDKGYMPKNFWNMFAALGAIARNGGGAANLAAEVLHEVATASAGDDYDPQGAVL